MTTPLPDPTLTAFYYLNPSFDLQTTDLKDPTNLSSLNWHGLDQATILQRLHAYQDLLTLIPDPTLIQKLIDKGYTSANQIATTPQGQFIQTVFPDIPTDIAQQIHPKLPLQPDPIPNSSTPPLLDDDDLAAFYHLNPTFDLKTFNFNDPAAVNSLNWQGLNQTANLATLKTNQRLLKVSPNADIANTLKQKGYSSANQIATLPEHKFLATVTPDIPTETAQTIHQQARHIRAQTLHLWATTHGIAASPHFRALQPNNTNDLAQHLQTLPGFSQLFPGVAPPTP